MPRATELLLQRGYWNQAGDDGGDAGGGGGGDTSGDGDAGDAAGADDTSIAGDEGTTDSDAGQDTDTSIAGDGGDDDGDGQGGEGDSGDDAADGDGDGDETGGAPEGGYAEFTLAEGTTLNQGYLDEFTAIATEDDLSQEQAQRYVDIAGRMVVDAIRESSEGLEQAFQAQQASNIAAVRKDPELGNANFDTTVANSRAAVTRFGGRDAEETAAFRAYLKSSGVGNNPLMVGFMARVGAMLAVDTIHDGEGDDGSADAAELLYPNDVPAKQ